LRTDYGPLVSAGGLDPEQATLLTEIRSLFAACEHTFTVSLTSAQDLLRELFTVKGAGTLVRRGTQVETVQTYQDLDQSRFAALLLSAFGREADPAVFARPALVIYLAAQYQGAAVLEAAPLAPYLSKFAVDIRAQGEGIGGDLWRALTRDHDRFFWRSRPDNPIAPWYASKCDGLVRGPKWTVYWRGLPTSEISQAVQLAEAAPVDFGVAS
jgi:acetylglutamate synthase